MRTVLVPAAATSLRQTTLRAQPELLRQARYFLDVEGKSLNAYLVEQLEHYVRRRAAQRSATHAEGG